MVQIAVAENSLNPANVEAAIRKALLPRRFPLDRHMERWREAKQELDGLSEVMLVN